MHVPQKWSVLPENIKTRFEELDPQTSSIDDLISLRNMCALLMCRLDTELYIYTAHSSDAAYCTVIDHCRKLKKCRSICEKAMEHVSVMLMHSICFSFPLNDINLLRDYVNQNCTVKQLPEKYNCTEAHVKTLISKLKKEHFLSPNSFEFRT